MATTTSSTDFAGHTDTSEDAAPKRSIFKRFLDGFTASQMRRARSHVRAHLSQMSDERLSDLGFTADEAKAVRAKGSIPVTYWL